MSGMEVRGPVICLIFGALTGACGGETTGSAEHVDVGGGDDASVTASGGSGSGGAGSGGETTTGGSAGTGGACNCGRIECPPLTQLVDVPGQCCPICAPCPELPCMDPMCGPDEVPVTDPGACCPTSCQAIAVDASTFACGDATCGPDQLCVHDSCSGGPNPCIATDDAGACPAGWEYVISCPASGSGGCMPPPCTDPPPYCVDMPAPCDVPDPYSPGCSCTAAAVCPGICVSADGANVYCGYE